MSGEVRAAGGRFLGAVAPGEGEGPPGRVSVVGVPWDGAVSYRAGAKAGPEGIRAASDSIESYCPRCDLDLADAPIWDHGDIAMPDVAAGGEAMVRAVREALATLPRRGVLALGGDHSIALPFLERALGQHPDLRIFHVDAHTDLRDHWEGDRYSHAAVMRRVLEVMPASARLVSWGIRSGLRDEFRLAIEDPRVQVLPAHPEPERGLAVARALADDPAPVYVTFDADGLDPSVLAGTGTPEPGGLGWPVVEDALVALIRGRAPVVGADLVEVAPPLDPSGVTSVVAARLARTLLLALRASGGARSAHPA